MKIQKVIIKTEFIKLDSFLKFTGAVVTGGGAKNAVKSEKVLVNGEVCTQRGRKIRDLDKVEFNGIVYEVFSE